MAVTPGKARLVPLVMWCVSVCLGFEEVSKEQLMIDPGMEAAALNLGERMALNVPA